MKIAAISDVHVKFPQDEADKFLQSFLNHPDVEDADYVLLLGDIYDLMCGPHDEYLQIFSHHFKKLDELQKQGKKIYFFEGNHDVHLEKLFKKIWKEDQIVLSQKPISKLIDGKKYYFSHGDEHEVDNHSYHKYMRLIRSMPLKFVADYLMPYFLLNFLGVRASKMSRKKGSKLFDAEAVRTKFRKGVVETTQGQYDFVLGGHSHVQDHYQLPHNGSSYINNGYALKSKTFILIENHVPRFVSLA